jgi:hypothetical protein
MKLTNKAGSLSFVGWIAAFCKPTFFAPMCWVNEKAVNPTYNLLPGV